MYNVNCAIHVPVKRDVLSCKYYFTVAWTVENFAWTVRRRAVYCSNANGDIRLQPPLPYFRAHGTVLEAYDDVGRFQERIMGLSSPSTWRKKRRPWSDSSVFHIYKRTCASQRYIYSQQSADSLNNKNPAVKYFKL